MKKIIRTPFSNMYEDKRFGSQLVTQGIMWESAEILDRDGDWLKLQLPDGYIAWSQNFSTCDLDEDLEKELEKYPRLLIHTPFCPIYDNKELTGNRIAVAALGARFPYTDRMDDLYLVLLPDGRKGFLRQEALPVTAPRDIILHIADQLLGTSYFWGGKSENGMDCSGLTQMCFSIANIPLLRDASQQLTMVNDAKVPLEKAKPGDLIFFQNEKGSITHVAIMKDTPEYIHSSGQVKLNSFDPQATNYLEKLHTMLQGVYSIDKLLKKKG